jgi:4-amino-4-deoxy-L-arabinose transferase-like glycosyltransferase
MMGGVGAVAVPPDPTSARLVGSAGSIHRVAIWLCIATLLVRLFTLPFPDLIDSTEGRYAAAALTMIEKGDYLTPWIDMGKGPEPYLGKPPMHFWLTVGCYRIFGVSAVSARLPSFISALLCALFLFLFVGRVRGTERATVALLVYLTSGLTFFLSGAAVLDTTLMLFVTGSLLLIASFYFCGFSRRPYLTSIGVGACLAGGFLTKGPVALAVVIATLLPLICVWLLIRKKIPSTPPRFPVVTTMFSFVALALPWYLACEYYSPGFLYYFIVKENLLRIVSDNYGDRYGTGHPQMFGMSILFLLLSFMPWSVSLLATIWKCVRKETKDWREWISLARFRGSDPVTLFAACWSLSMPAFLLLTSQYTANYLAPIMPGLAIWYATLVAPRGSRTLKLSEDQRKSFGIVGALFVPVACCVCAALPAAGILFFSASAWVLAWAVGGCVLALCLSRIVQGSGIASQMDQVVQRCCFVSALLILVFFSVFASLSPYVSSRRSTREVLALVRGETASKHGFISSPVRVNFVEQLPFSAAVYGSIGEQKLESRKLSIADLPQSASNSQCDYYVTSTRLLQQRVEVFKQLTEVGRTLKWVALRDSECVHVP